MSTIANSTIKLSLDSTSVQRGIAKIKAGFAGMNDSIGRGIGNLATSTAKWGAAIAAGAAAFAAFKVSQFAVDSVKAAMGFEALSVQFEVLTGSAEKAQKILAEIQEFGATTPLEQKDLQEATKVLLAMGVALEDVMPTLRMLGDVSLGNGEKLQSLALVFGQISSAGKLQGQDLLQLINLGFNPLQQIAKKTGESMLVLKDRMAKGEISMDMVRGAFEDATGSGGLFENMLVRMGETGEGKFSNLLDGVEALKRGFGEGLLGAVKLGLGKINEEMTKLDGIFRKAGEQIGIAIAEGMAGNMEPIRVASEYIAAVIKETIYASLMQMMVEGGQGVGKGLSKGAKFTSAPQFVVGKTMEWAGVDPLGSSLKTLDVSGYTGADYKDTFGANRYGSEEKLQELIEIMRRIEKIPGARPDNYNYDVPAFPR